MSDTKTGPGVVGWREWVELPDLSLGPMIAKIDTGAQTSALHATDIIKVSLPDGQAGVRFRVYPDHQSADEYSEITAPLHDVRQVRNSGGTRSVRMVIDTRLRMGNLLLRAEITLVDRSTMRYPMLIGRSTLRKAGVLVDARKSWLHGSSKIG